MMPTVNQYVLAQQTRHIDPMFDQCWADVVDGVPALVQHWMIDLYVVFDERESICIVDCDWFTRADYVKPQVAPLA